MVNLSVGVFFHYGNDNYFFQNLYFFGEGNENDHIFLNCGYENKVFCVYYGNENDLFLCMTEITFRIFYNIMVTRTNQENLS